MVPYSALLYQPDGSNVIYTVTGPLTYTADAGRRREHPGQPGLPDAGPAPGTAVVTVGGEELHGVQDGVGVQT